MLKQLGITAPTLEIVPEECEFLMQPSPDSETIPANDPVIHGKLVLRLHKRKNLKSIRVRVVQRYNISFPDLQYETGEKIISEVRVLPNEGTERVFEKGEHVFNFLLVCPASTAPYERTQYGKVYHDIEASCEGDGMLESNITARTPIAFVVNPAPVGETLEVNMHVERFHPDIGPYAISATTRHATVGGLIAVTIVLASTVRRTRILSITSHINTYYTITSVSGATKSLDPRKSTSQSAVKKPKIFLVDAENLPDHLISESRNEKGKVQAGRMETGSGESSKSLQTGRPMLERKVSGKAPLVVIEAGGSYHMNHLSRIPNDDIARPSTMKGTITPIHVRNELSITIAFQTVDEDGVLGAEQALICESEIQLSSCFCQIPTLIVPQYSAIDLTPSSPGAVTPPPHHPRPHHRPINPFTASWIAGKGTLYNNRDRGLCACMHSKEQLIAQQQEQNPRFETEWRNGHARLVDEMIRRQLVSERPVRRDGNGKFEYVPEARV